MKKVLTILTIVTIAFASCSKAKKLNKRLTGKWTITTKDYQFFYNNVLTPAQSYKCTTGVGSVELKSDGTGTISDPTNAAGDLAVYKVTDWFNDDTHVTMLVTDQNSLVNQMTFDITTNESDKQVWYNEFNSQSIAGKVQSKTTYDLTAAK